MKKAGHALKKNLLWLVRASAVIDVPGSIGCCGKLMPAPVIVFQGFAFPNVFSFPGVAGQHNSQRLEQPSPPQFLLSSPSDLPSAFRNRARGLKAER